MNKRVRIFKWCNWLFLIVCYLIACSPDQSPDDRKTFSPDPRPVEAQEVPILEIDAEAPDFNLPGTDGKFHTLADFQESEILVLIFTCNHCPTAQAYEERIKSVAHDYKESGVQVVAISPNSPLSLLYEECGYTDLDDDYEAMIIRARNQQFSFPYLYDGDNHSASLKYGPVATPHAFVFDGDRKLQYRGRLDASEKPGTANAEDLRQAIDAVLAGDPVPVPVTKSFGCSVKWAWKTEWKEQVEENWNLKEIEVKEIDLQGLKEVLSNPSENLRLINFWATWCGPCRIEFPEFLIMQRMYGARNFEFVSVSLDNVEQEQAVLKFLKEVHSPVINYLCSETDKYKVIETVDPSWDGALPYTLLVEPGGNKYYTQPGTITPLDVKRAIVDHPLIGRYY
jgi:thiol-disulfide isomerase/thioredoxin